MPAFAPFPPDVGLICVPQGRVSAAGHINRCSPVLQVALRELMEYCWEPALVVARANTVEMGGAARSARSNHTWDRVLERLEALRKLGVPLLQVHSNA